MLWRRGRESIKMLISEANNVNFHISGMWKFVQKHETKITIDNDETIFRNLGLGNLFDAKHN